MARIRSELPGARARELIADAATVAWVAVWSIVGWQLYVTLAEFSGAGRTIRDGGRSLTDAGRALGDALAGVPLVGEGLRDVARNAFAGAGTPLATFGTDVEAFVVLVAGVLAVLLLLVTLTPWLTRYVPWRLERLRTLRAGHRAIRIAPAASAQLLGEGRLDGGRLDELLAMRAVTRLDYATLLEYTPDPLGDWASGRHDRLARAELASVGLRP
jgi:hypothetical protein